MKVLLLVQKSQRVILDGFYDAIQKHTGCDICALTSDEQANLEKWFSRHPETKEYDRIVLFLRFKKELRQIRFIRTIPNLVILEHDAYQNYIPCKYQGKFSAYYKKLPWARILTSGYVVSEKLRTEGFNALFCPKGYDENMMKNTGGNRDIETGFVGSIKNGTYSKRKSLLTTLAETENLLITRTASGKDYIETLNRIRFFISADVGMGEYMIKNFEAMACGCVLFAWNQGQIENSALGFKDMENTVLYSTIEECRKKLAILRKDEELARRIALAGQRHVENHFTFDHAGKKVADFLAPPLRKKSIKQYLGMKFYGWMEPTPA